MLQVTKCVKYINHVEKELIYLDDKESEPCLWLIVD